MLTCVAGAASSTVNPGAIQLSASNYSVAPSAGAVTVTVNRVAGSSGIAIATYGTFDGSAVAGTDYAPAFGTLTWADGDSTPKTFTVPVVRRSAHTPRTTLQWRSRPTIRALY
jgi:hypothetical protein